MAANSDEVQRAQMTVTAIGGLWTWSIVSFQAESGAKHGRQTFYTYNQQSEGKL